MDCKRIYWVALVFLLPGAILAEIRPTSLSVMGGGGGYSYSQQPDAFSVGMYTMLNEALLVPSSDPLKAMADVDAFSPMRFKGNSSVLRAQYEELFLADHRLGWTAGFSYTHTRETCLTHCGQPESLVVAKYMGTTRSGPTIALLLGGLGAPILPAASVSYDQTMAEFGLNYHFIPEAQFDPFLGLSGGLGLCTIPDSNAVTCTVAKAAIRAGARVNLSDHFYLLFQGEAEHLQLSVTTVDQSTSMLLRIPSPDKHILFGLGYNL